MSATHHLLLGHAGATEALRSAVSAPVGITLNLSFFYGVSDHPDDQAATVRAEGNFNRLFLESVFHSRYPIDMADHYAGLGPEGQLVAPGDLESIAQPLDFLGINYYSPQHIAHPSKVSAAQAAGYSVSHHRTDPVADDLGFASVRRANADETSRVGN